MAVHIHSVELMIRAATRLTALQDLCGQSCSRPQRFWDHGR